MSDCTEPRWNELLGAYALGACTPAEQAGMREHLASCSACTADLLELGAAREALLTAVPPATASPALKSRVMTQVRADAELFAAAREREDPAPRRTAPERRRRAGWLSRPVPLAAALACAAVLAVGAGTLAAALVSDGGAGGARTVAAQVDGTQAPGASARLVVDGEGGSRLVVAGLPSPGPGRVWQVWLRTGEDAPRPAGALFAVDREGDGEAAVPGPLDGVDQVLVSSEPAGGSQAPTRTPVLSAQV